MFRPTARGALRTLLSALLVGGAFGCLTACADGGFDLNYTGGGPAVSPDDWPAIALINTPEGWCTGVLVESDKILTAGHCVIMRRLMDAEARASAAIVAELEAGKREVEQLSGASIFPWGRSEADVEADVLRILRASLLRGASAARAIYESTPRQVYYTGTAYLRAASGDDPDRVSYEVLSADVYPGFWDAVAGAGARCTDRLTITSIDELEGVVRAYGDCLKARELSGDIALLQLGTDVTEMHPMRVATPEDATFLDRGVSVSTLGYGTPFGLDGQLHRNNLTVENPDCVGEPCEDHLELLASGDDYTCKGDSGGPLVAEIDGEDVIVGILSGRLREDVDRSSCHRRARFERVDAVTSWYTQDWTPPPPREGRPEYHPDRYGPDDDYYYDDGGGCSATAGGGGAAAGGFIGVMLSVLALRRRRRRHYPV